MSEDGGWVERCIKAANQAAPNGIAALALIFGILMVLMVLVILRR
jgi:hypothetical protein